jgi:hypothetical protein
MIIAEDKLEDYGKRIEELEKRLASLNLSGNNGIDASALSDFMKKSDMQDLLKRLEKVEKKAKKAKEGAKKAKKKIDKWKP